jgi:D-alanyl-D-alanine carboxypeptidase/D-alanyl-D-alanine-endopeptidase (penicillin-binding protein 4)
MGRAAAGVAAGLATVLAVGAAYLTLDAYDAVPGVVTLAPLPAPAQPVPTAPGAVAAPEVTPVVADLDPAAALPDAAAVQALADGLAADARMGGSTGVVVSDVLTGEVLADVGGDLGQVPASTAKVLTALASLRALGAATTLPTTVVQPTPGRLVLVGGGDMMLGAEEGDPAAVMGHAGLADLASQVARSLTLAGTTSVSLAFDDTLFSGAAIHPRWTPSDVAAGYVAAVSPMAVMVAKTDPSEEYPARYPDPALDVASRFAALLTAQGITVTSTARGEAPTGATELGRVESAPVGDIVEYVLHVSDNSVAEVLGRLVAIRRGLPATFEGAATAVLAEVRALGVDTTGATLDDSSGLSAASLVPPRLLVDALIAAQEEQVALVPLLTDLPVGGWQGTLADRFTSGPAEGLIRAKTGSLPGVTSLAGMLQTTSGRLLVFAVLADATPAGGQYGPRAAIDEMLASLAALDRPA